MACTKMILNLNAVENVYFRGNIKDTDIVVRISAKTYSRRANIYCTSNSDSREMLAFTFSKPAFPSCGLRSVLTSLILSFF